MDLIEASAGNIRSAQTKLFGLSSFDLDSIFTHSSEEDFKAKLAPTGSPALNCVETSRYGGVFVGHGYWRLSLIFSFPVIASQ